MRTQDARIAIVGLGRTGTRLAPLLLKHGIVNLVLIDRDYLEQADLRDCPLYKNAQPITPKAELAAKLLKKTFPKARIKAVVEDLNPSTAAKLLKPVDIVCDCTDNWPARSSIAQYCRQAGKPWAYAGALRSKAMCSTIIAGEKPCWNCWNPKPKGQPESCSVAGVNPKAAQKAVEMQCSETIKLTKKQAPGLVGKLWFYNSGKESVLELNANPQCNWCKGHGPEKERQPQASLTCGEGQYQFLNLQGTKPFGPARIAKLLSPLKPISRGALAEVRIGPVQAIVFPGGRVLARSPTAKWAQRANRKIVSLLTSQPNKAR